MPPVALRNIEDSVPPLIRRRGEEYARAGAVVLTARRPPKDAIAAIIRGNHLYHVKLRYADRTLWSDCSCPYFTDRLEICKHIWATVLECDKQRVEFPDHVDHLVAESDQPASRAEIVPIRREWHQPSRWREQIGSIRSGDADAAVAPPAQEITWVLDPTASGTDIVIEITSQSLSKTQPLRIGWPVADYVIPALVESGRLLIRTGKNEYERCTAFDAGEPWRLVVRAEERGGRHVLVATLSRGEESVPLTDALAVTRGGFAIYRDSIVRFQDDGLWQWANLLRRETIEIPAAELDDFIKAVATSGTPLPVEFPGGARWDERRVAPRATLELRDGAYWLLGKASFEYDGHTISALDKTASIYDDATKTIFIRDTAEEDRKLNALWRQGIRRDGDSIGLAPNRLHDVLPKLMEAGWEVRSPDGAYAPPGGELAFEVRSGIDWFDVDGTISFGSERVNLPRLLTALRKGDATVRLDDGRLGLLRAEWRDQLEPFLAAASDEHEGGLRFRPNQVLLLDALLAKRPAVSFDEVFERARRRLLDVTIVPEIPGESFLGTLRPYQSEGLGWFNFLREAGFGGCLADDMGLGKTIQVLALLDQRRVAAGKERRPSLVVVPRSLVFNWKAEAARFAPELRLLDHSTPERVRDASQFAGYDVVLTTYALLRKEAELFAGVEFDYAILDEAQAIKNASSQAAQAATLLRAQNRLALSGTPVENHLGELASLFEFLNPGMLRGKSNRMTKTLRNAGGSTAEAAEARGTLARAVRPFILRRTKGQVAQELPPRVEQTIWCELEPKQRKLYDELRDYYRTAILGRVATSGVNRSKIQILEALLRMRQAACHPALIDDARAGEGSAKFDALFEELPILIEEGHKVLVFSQFTSLLSLVRDELRVRGITHAYIDGKTRDRESEVARFQNDPTVPLFLISLKAGGVGLNLTAAEYVFLLDPWWNPAVEAQAIDRAHRIGQTRSVFAYRLVARDTIEEKILQLQQNKRELAEAIIGEENSILRQLTAEDLELLLS